jgi:hypothetical protein
MKTFSDLQFGPHPAGNGVQAIIQFTNGFGASVVKTPYSYGGSQGKYELAVTDSDGRLCYSTEVTNDVVGYLSPDEVTEYLRQIQILK